MPIHDWTLVDAGLFHAFHQGWIGALCDALNLGVLPPDFYALMEQRIAGPIPDVLISRLSLEEEEIYAARADRIAVRYQQGRLIAVIEIVSPGNKDSLVGLREFVEGITQLISQNVHLLVIDLFPPGPCDPQGIHKAIWDEIQNDSFELPKDKPLTLTSYDAGSQLAAYIELVAVGEALPDMPLFLESECYISVPLEATYQTKWKAFPAILKKLLEGPDAKPPLE